MTTIYNRTDYVMLPRIQAARAEITRLRADAERVCRAASGRGRGAAPAHPRGVRGQDERADHEEQAFQALPGALKRSDSDGQSHLWRQPLSLPSAAKQPPKKERLMMSYCHGAEL